ncbi:MAG: NnrU family protein [Xanthomonadales bacterium]|nr:NnrU family protein [Gammaproteobacteria bacterium]MBT8054265.1 NnrU family protein [Gammaproteobacteria bacterium]NND57542.1 NnrU family protein [Xanthomonadales bacterium]NNK51266.1 NnrU family protein [Xanthomonadales bacterium]
MTKLLLGVLLWSVIHFIPAVAADFRKSVIAKIGEQPYKGIFALFMVLALYLIISGWKSTIPESMYLPPAWGRHATALLVLISFFLFIAPYHATNLKRFLRHPQLSGVFLWGIAHLLANGEGRSIVLFGGLSVWAVIEILLLNRRDGGWIKPDRVPPKKDIILVVAGLVSYLVIAFAHEWLFGFSPFA